MKEKTADEVMRDLKEGRKPVYDGLRNRTSKIFKGRSK